MVEQSLGTSAGKATLLDVELTGPQVIQECAIHAEHPLVGCGDRWLPWSVYANAYKAIREHRERSPLANAIDAFYLRTLVNIRDAVQRNGTTLDLGNLLITTTIFDATDPRDKVYALYGLINEVHQKKIIVDYTLTVSELYTRVGAVLLGNNVNFLGYNTASPNHDLPSWVPDWTFKGDRNVMLGGGLYKAGGGPTVRPDADVDTRQLLVHASRLCRVGMIDPSPPSRSLTRAELIRKIESFEETMRRAIRDYPENEAVSVLLPVLDPRSNDGLMRTVVADSDFTGPDVNDVAGDTSSKTRPAPKQFWYALQVLQNRMSVPADYEPRLDGEERKRRYTEKFVFNAQRALSGSRFFITDWGLIGISHHSVREGDYVMIVFDLDMPLLVRPAGPDTFNVVGVAYLHLMMDGEALKLDIVEGAREMLPGQECTVCLV
ncbi:uncharacterized protein CTRU02_208360 [Colletotrichum truncatum]|uniref:Uncharacterized protein n=1 Tax=Colletotrichum truncatum TaxID=5467 RepID=A0ACC3YW15_COLTU